jgi:hypothetical protein
MPIIDMLLGAGVKGQGFCDDYTKALVLKNYDDLGLGVKYYSKLCHVIYRRSPI